jgi:hypothetical protein
VYDLGTGNVCDLCVQDWYAAYFRQLQLFPVFLATAVTILLSIQIDIPCPDNTLPLSRVLHLLRTTFVSALYIKFGTEIFGPTETKVWNNFTNSTVAYRQAVRQQSRNKQLYDSHC